MPGLPPIPYTEIGSGRTVIVLHGGPGLTHDYLRPEWDRLARAARVVYYDQRGCGLTAPELAELTTWEDHVRDLDRVISHLAPDGRVVLAGSSWGAQLALLYTLQHPERVAALVLSGTPAWHRKKRPSPLTPEERLELERKVTELIRQGKDLPPTWFGPRERPEFYGVDSAFASRFTDNCDPTATFASLESIPPMTALGRIDVPALLLSGTGSSVPDGTEPVAAQLPRAAVVTFEGAGHDPWYTSPNEFFDAVQRFLRSLPRQP